MLLFTIALVAPFVSAVFVLTVQRCDLPTIVAEHSYTVVFGVTYWSSGTRNSAGWCNMCFAHTGVACLCSMTWCLIVLSSYLVTQCTGSSIPKVGAVLKHSNS